MKTRDRHAVDRPDETTPPVKRWQDRHGAALIMASFGVLVLAMVLVEVFRQ